MRITSADVLVASPGRNFVTLPITTEDGAVGLGDATLNGRELAVAAYLSEHVVPLLIGRDAHRIEDTWQFLYRGAYWRRGPVTMASIAAVDTALWDIKAQLAGQPLWRLLGGLDRTVPAYASGLDLALSHEQLASADRTYAERGLRVAKLKGGLDVDEDRARLVLVRDLLAEALPGSRPGLMLDANEAWAPKQAVRYVARLEESIDLIWVEEPVRRWDADGMVAVGRGVRASVAGGENLTGVEQVRPLLAARVLALALINLCSVQPITTCGFSSLE